jgi:hypothetical protein
MIRRGSPLTLTDLQGQMMKLRRMMIALAFPLAPAAIGAQTANQSQMVALDFVKAKPGELARLVRYFELNWAVARDTVKAQRGGVVSYRILVTADTSSAWDVMLETVYADSSAYARREEIFAPVLKAKGKVLVDGKDRSAFGDIVGSRLVTTPKTPRR